jgi:hypothetical protein
MFRLRDMNPPQSVKIVALSSDIVIQGANHLKWLMTFFEHLSSLKINYHKNDLIAINLDEHEEVQFSKKIVTKWEIFFLSI